MSKKTIICVPHSNWESIKEILLGMNIDNYGYKYHKTFWKNHYGFTIRIFPAWSHEKSKTYLHFDKEEKLTIFYLTFSEHMKKAQIIS